MTENTDSPHKNKKSLPRNIWAVSLTSFLTDISSEMVINVLPLFLANVLGVRTNVIGLIEGVAESTASLLKVFSGWFSDRIGGRKWLAVAGYGLSTLVKPLYYFANTWGWVAVVRWGDRVGKGIRTAPRDALVADSIAPEQRGLAFGLHRAADTAGAMVGLALAWLIVWRAQAGAVSLDGKTFQTIVLVSLIPAALAVLTLVVGVQDVVVKDQRAAPKITFRKLGRPFLVFLGIVGVFELGNSADAFLLLRMQERGMSVLGVLGMVAAFNFVYALLSTPAGWLSDRVGRVQLIVGGWLVYAALYLGFGLAQTGPQAGVMYILYGVYYALSYGTAKALVADLVPKAFRGTAYGTYNAILGIIDLPASLIAGILWQGTGAWKGFGAGAPFFFGAFMALAAAVALVLWQRKNQPFLEN